VPFTALLRHEPSLPVLPDGRRKMSIDSQPCPTAKTLATSGGIGRWSGFSNRKEEAMANEQLAELTPRRFSSAPDRSRKERGKPPTGQRPAFDAPLRVHGGSKALYPSTHALGSGKGA
jgi:hypothetical protein